jgi:hypothetical protein
MIMLGKITILIGLSLTGKLNSIELKNGIINMIYHIGDTWYFEYDFEKTLDLDVIEEEDDEV